MEITTHERNGHRDNRPAVDPRLTALRKCELFNTVPPSALEELARQCRQKAFETRSSIYLQGDSGSQVYVVATGRVRLLRVCRDERELTIAYEGPGSLLGDELFVDGTFGLQARAAERVSLISLPLRALESAVTEFPALGVALLRTALVREQACQMRMEGLLSRPVESRVANFLVDAMEQHGVPEARGHLVAVKYTHLEIACFVGSTRETVTLVLGDLKRRGIIEIDHRRVVVCDADQLRALT